MKKENDFSLSRFTSLPYRVTEPTRSISYKPGPHAAMLHTWDGVFKKSCDD